MARMRAMPDVPLRGLRALMWHGVDDVKHHIVGNPKRKV
jgi:hypothetical protein